MVGVDSFMVIILGGNLYLKFYEVNQLDVLVEYYVDNGNVYLLVFFYKDIFNFILIIIMVGFWEGNILLEFVVVYVNLG